MEENTKNENFFYKKNLTAKEFRAYYKHRKEKTVSYFLIILRGFYEIKKNTFGRFCFSTLAGGGIIRI
ncbi:hypothetical protein [Treponema sp.]|uniref:hypothetical protein n=1 Tax=Treponema sp. TaxID=166 RepID=UPI003F05075A